MIRILDEVKAEAEFQGICNEVASEMNGFQSQNYWNMFRHLRREM